MKKYIKPYMEVIDLKARGLMEEVGIHGSAGVDQDPNNNTGDSGSFGARPHTIVGGHMDGAYNSVWDR